MSSSNTPALFQPIQVGDIKLGHRVVLSPLTRIRANGEHVHGDLALEYYKQRASVPGTLLITEATYISPQAGGMANVPGIYNDAQIAAWKKITDAVHEKGSYIYLQLWALGRAARPASLHEENPDYPYVSASPIALSTSPDDVPRALTKEEIKQYIQWYATAAANSVHKAGFDGVEIHGANGYLIDQFLQDVSNKRTDEYGGSIENRARFALEVTEAVVAAVGQSKTAMRLSPWSLYQDMREENPIPTVTYLVEQYKKKYPNLAYIHVVGPGGPGSKGPDNEEDTHFVQKLWAPRPVITTGGYDRESGIKVAEETGQIVGYGRAFLSNPDLPFRLQNNIKLNDPEYDSFYLPMAAKGYTTYPFSEEFLKTQPKA
ncbi:NADH:flavin oxidoreductase/NADH oxidase [Trametes versicolor FP-101664 SS1]|uniref:NADH:flavin oxidoreductase/NADH oxidase n=1 Tax=Trametes versicolor (strain FP-101664) TaxID=717944 RepID=UPI00046219DB|nr:NADH:flavin oxidoreductase/NADH oxidase [Trametes versicolor FP-101664 SS1]EIW62644.1 NADH:flavin oxidoreductase/NADH oxidase [Trametes versicolor FP-101664 SS1]